MPAVLLATYGLFTDALAVHRVDHRPGATFKSDGRYKIRVYLNDRVAIEYYFVVRSPQASSTA